MSPSLSSHAAEPVCHLSEEEVDEVLLDCAGPSALAHLSGCTRCQARVSAFSDVMAEFNGATLRWAEAKSSTMPLLTPPSAGWRLRWPVLAPAAASLVFGFALFLHLHPTPGDPVVQPVVTAELDPDPGQIARDNAMLEAIDSEMQPVESPLAPYRNARVPAAPALPLVPQEMRN